jgi:hypothetical protein
MASLLALTSLIMDRNFAPVNYESHQDIVAPYHETDNNCDFSNKMF